MTLTIQTLAIIGLSTILFYIAGLELWVSLLIGGISVATASAPVLEITKNTNQKDHLQIH